jgi:hypothetical protein
MMLGTLYELGTPEIINPHDKTESSDSEIEITWRPKEDIFTQKPKDRPSKQQGSSSGDRPQTPQRKDKEPERQPQTPQKPKGDKPLP